MPSKTSNPKSETHGQIEANIAQIAFDTKVQKWKFDIQKMRRDINSRYLKDFGVRFAKNICFNKAEVGLEILSRMEVPGDPSITTV